MRALHLPGGVPVTAAGPGQPQSGPVATPADGPSRRRWRRLAAAGLIACIVSAASLGSVAYSTLLVSAWPVSHALLSRAAVPSLSPRRLSLAPQVIATRPPQVAITSPAVGFSHDAGESSSVTLSGTGANITGCTWTNSLGGSGAATTALSGATLTWTAGSVSLTVGSNVLTVTCGNGAGTFVAQAITVTRSSSGTGETTLDCVSNTCYYIRDGGTASLSGTGACNSTGTGTWNTANACDTLPATLVRGAFYVFAAGTYGSFALNTAPSGSTPITLVKATVANHGTATGWSAAYADQATLGSLSLHTDYWTLNGQTRNESDWRDVTTYGFGLSTGADISAATDASGGVCASNITLKYFHGGGTIRTTLIGDDSEPSHVIYVAGYAELCANWYVGYSYLHNINHAAHMHMNGVDTITVERNYIEYGWGKESIRGQIAFKNGVIRWNRFVNACGQSGVEGEGCTAEIALWDGNANGFDANDVYGNYFLRTRDDNAGGTIIIGDSGVQPPVTNNSRVFNNTIVGVPGGSLGMYIFVNGGTGNVCRNNYWYDVPTTVVDPGCSANTSTNNVETLSNPFVAYTHGSTTHDLHLTAATPAGSSSGSPAGNSVDMDGVARGGDGNWDVGAFEKVN